MLPNPQTAEDEIREEESLGILVGMMGDLDREVARRVLRKFAGDLERAADAILSGDRGEQQFTWTENVALAGGDQAGGGALNSASDPNALAVAVSTTTTTRPANPSPAASPRIPATTSHSNIQNAAGEASNATPTATIQNPPILRRYSYKRPASQGSPSSVIDLTGDDDWDMHSHPTLEFHDETPAYASDRIGRTMSRGRVGRGSSASNEVRFGPSDRAPDPAWAMVPSNTRVDTQSDEERNLKLALEASLTSMVTNDDSLPFEETIREGGRPVAIRPEQAGHAYAALTLQCLFFVPQIRRAIAALPFVQPPEGLSVESTERTMRDLVELFTNLDLAQLSAMVDKEVTPRLGASLWGGPANDNVADVSSDLIGRLGYAIEEHIRKYSTDEDAIVKYFHFTHGCAEIAPGQPPRLQPSLGDGCVVGVDTGTDQRSPNDLVSRLAANLSQYQDYGTSTHEVIFDLSEMVAFQLKPPASDLLFSDPTSKGTANERFAYPSILYLDRFLSDNVALVHAKKMEERKLAEDVRQLTLERQNLTKHNDRDTLKDLNTTLYYFENVAGPRDLEERRTAIEKTVLKLKAIIKGIVAKVEQLDRNIEELKNRADNLYECPELKKHRYDLRAVIFYTGVPGRRQLYSYVQDENRTWWKTVDYTVTQVSEETVMTDTTGTALGAGPFILFYSKYLPDEELKKPVEWPKAIADCVQGHNDKFLAMLPPELVSKAKVMESLKNDSNTRNESEDIPSMPTSTSMSNLDPPLSAQPPPKPPVPPKPADLVSKEMERPSWSNEFI